MSKIYSDEGWNFEESNFIMADILNLTINESLNVGQPKLRESLQ